FARTLARARVGLRPLSAHGQVAAVPQPPPAADLHQPLDVHRDFLPQVAFDVALLLDDPADLPDVVFRQVLDAHVRAHARRDEDVVRAFPADPVDVGQADFDPLRARQIHSSYTCHVSSSSTFNIQHSAFGIRHSLALSLLVLLIGTDHAHDAAAANDLA